MQPGFVLRERGEPRHTETVVVRTASVLTDLREQEARQDVPCGATREEREPRQHVAPSLGGAFAGKTTERASGRVVWIDLAGSGLQRGSPRVRRWPWGELGVGSVDSVCENLVRRWPGARAAGRFFAHPRRAHRECLLSLGSAGGRCSGIEDTEGEEVRSPRRGARPGPPHLLGLRECVCPPAPSRNRHA